VLDQNIGQLDVMWKLTAFAGVLALALGAFSWRTARGDEQTRVLERDSSAGRTILSRIVPLFYFSLLGVGFMLVEIPLAQKLILPLGYPTLALTTILFSVLLGGGIGSWFSQRVADVAALRRYAAMCALGVAMATVGGTALLNRYSDTLLLLPLATRCLVVGAALLPLGFLLGTPFPAGMRLLSQRNAANVPLIWGLNGVGSVVGSLCAAMFAKSWGFSTVLGVGAALYLIAAATLFLLGRDASASASAGSDSEYSRETAPASV
jgi:predicted MFS family arabinose efflux permease